MLPSKTAGCRLEIANDHSRLPSPRTYWNLPHTQRTTPHHCCLHLYLRNCLGLSPFHALRARSLAQLTRTRSAALRLRAACRLLARLNQTCSARAVGDGGHGTLCTLPLTGMADWDAGHLPASLAPATMEIWLLPALAIRAFS